MRKIIYSKLYSKTPLVKKTPYKTRTQNLNLHKNPTFKTAWKFADIRCLHAVQGSQFLHILAGFSTENIAPNGRASWGASSSAFAKLYPQQLATSWIVGGWTTHLNRQIGSWIPNFQGKKKQIFGTTIQNLQHLSGWCSTPCCYPVIPTAQICIFNPWFTMIGQYLFQIWKNPHWPHLQPVKG